MTTITFRKAASLLPKGAIGVMPTDTIYGVVASARDREAIERVYGVKRRAAAKPCILLISSVADIGEFGIRPSARVTRLLQTWWPGKVSVVLPCPSKKYEYLHRGAGSIAFRLPAWAPLHTLLKKTGPIIAPSANLEGQPPAQTIKEAYTSFGESVDFYVNGGELPATPSTLVEIKNGKVTILRQGVHSCVLTRGKHTII